MKCKALIIVLLLLTMPNVVFADMITILETTVELPGGEVLFKTQGGIHQIDCRCQPSRVITITEKKLV